MDRRLFFPGTAGGFIFLLVWASLSVAATVSIPITKGADGHRNFADSHPGQPGRGDCGVSIRLGF